MSEDELPSCCFCGFTSKSSAVFVAMGDRTRCKSGAACMRRLRAGDMLRRPIRLELEPATQWPHHKTILEFQARARDQRNARYREGLCCDCGRRRYSPGRPRCDDCHAQLIEFRKLGLRGG